MSSRVHHCHALNCDRAVPPRLHMCAPHWRMVPKPLQRALWAAYKPGQERRMNPSAEYLRSAAACVRAVAEAEGQPPDEIDADVETVLLPADIGFVMHLPPAGEYVALHDTTFHLHEHPERTS